LLGQQHPVKMVFPRAIRSSGISTLGVRYLVPETGEDEPALKKLIELRPHMVDTILETLKKMMFVNLSDIVWIAVHFFDHLSVLTPERFEELYEKTENLSEWRLQRFASMSDSQKKGRFKIFTLSATEVVVVKNSEVGQRLILGLERILQNNKRLFNGELKMEKIIKDLLASNQTCIITPEEFLRDTPGITAVSHQITREGKAHKVVVVFERRFEDNRWRCVMATLSAVNNLFGGERLAHHYWSSKDVSTLPHITRLLEQGVQVILQEDRTPVRMEDALEDLPKRAKRANKQ